ncbi:chordin-like isoform X1 [Mya arenaria]|uniref:chordin-like isoform X1 n=1 Tax=Mya arenaria TaxID=6604 RepID=UPI0022E066DD|nr:chordin-like isoform X1 [Mya arenaria]
MMDRPSSVIIFVGLALVMSTLVECGCQFEGAVHDVGSTWHPEIFGTCVNCTCRLGNNDSPEVTCVNTAEKCPKLDCDNPTKDPHSCCPYCEDIPNLPPTVSSDKEKSSSLERSPCQTTSGRIYQHGERYASNDTGIRRNTEDQCVMCICQNGDPLCYLKTCPKIPTGCSAILFPEDDCCPRCADITEVENSESDCLDNQLVKKNGSTWHPSIVSIGEITCVTCTCSNGEIKCHKDCIPDYELPCRNPQKPSGECCRSCPDNTQTTGSDATEEKPKDKKKRKKKKDRKKGKKDKRKDKKRRKRCKDNKESKKCKRRRRRKDRKDKKARPPAEVTAITTGVDLATLCFNRRRKPTHLVYKSISETDLMIAFDEIAADTVHVFRWTVKKSNDRSLVTFNVPEKLSAQQFRRTINNTNVVGTTSASQYRKFKKRLTAKLETCSADCEPEMFINILQRVKLKLLKFGDPC